MSCIFVTSETFQTTLVSLDNDEIPTIPKGDHVNEDIKRHSFIVFSICLNVGFFHCVHSSKHQQGLSKHTYVPHENENIARASTPDYIRSCGSVRSL